MTGAKGALAVLLALLLSACAAGTGPGDSSRAGAGAGPTRGLSDIQATFEQAMVGVPLSDGQMQLEHMADLRLYPPRVDRPLPAVIYMHGCTGIGDTTIIQAMAAAGFLVIAPDSMARSYRPLQCDVRTGVGGFNLFVYDMRAEELSYALNALRQFPFIDRSNLFLVGGSEGGVTAALYRGDDFRARVIAAWTCHGAPLVAGVAAPPGEPVLAVVSADDPWYRNGKAYGQEGDCGVFIGGRPNSRSIVLPAGSGHGVLANPDARRQIIDFLRANRLG